MINPETEFHRREIASVRAQRRKMGIAAMWFCGIFFLLFAAFDVTSLLDGSISIGGFLQMFLVIGGMLACSFYLMGFDEYRRGIQPVTEREVARERQRERARLFREAQGELPHSLRTWRIVVEGIFGAILTIGGIYSLISWFPQHEIWLLVYGITFIFCGIALMWLAFYLKPRRAKQVAAWSAQELVDRIALGETTEGNIRGDS
jgi:hypothetical protein